MPRIAQSFLEALANLAFEGFGQSGGAAGSLKSNERRETRHVEFLRLGERLDRHQLAFAENASRFDIFVDQTFHGKNQLVVERRHGLFGKASYIKFERIGAATEAAHEFSAADRSHAGRKA